MPWLSAQVVNCICGVHMTAFLVGHNVRVLSKLLEGDWAVIRALCIAVEDQRVQVRGAEGCPRDRASLVLLEVRQNVRCVKHDAVVSTDRIHEGAKRQAAAPPKQRTSTEEQVSSRMEMHEGLAVTVCSHWRSPAIKGKRFKRQVKALLLEASPLCAVFALKQIQTVAVVLVFRHGVGGKLERPGIKFFRQLEMRRSRIRCNQFAKQIMMRAASLLLDRLGKTIAFRSLARFAMLHNPSSD